MSHDSEDSDSMIMSMRDWRQALKSPPTYRIGNRTLRIQTKFLSIFLLACVLVIFYRYFKLSTYSSTDRYRDVRFHSDLNHGNPYVVSNVAYADLTSTRHTYNATYPLTKPIRSPEGLVYRIAVVSDLDTNSKSKTDDNSWVSYLQKGYLTWNPSLNSVRVSWDKEYVELKSSLSQGGRGMELSELIVFNGRLYAMDDRTGVVYEIVGSNAVPWVILTDGDGKSPKGFKSEWSTVKAQRLLVGGLGKEWTNSKGDIINYDPQWIKSVTPNGEVTHVNWKENYLKMRHHLGVSYPGYMIHESAAWSDVHKKWFFLPRRFSKEPYHEETDELMGTNLLITCDEHFNNIKYSKVGEVYPSHGFSSFKFIPGSEDNVIVAIKSEELKGSVATYITAFKIDGTVLLPESKVDDNKFEGIEFI